MCLVSYVPTDYGFVFSSNRDEAPERSAKVIAKEKIDSKEVYYPADTAGGSWIFASDHGDIICLLNGGFVIHNRKAKYKMSRGLMLKAFFKYANVVDFFEHFDFYDIEPFTCIIVSREYFFEFVWDGAMKHVRSLDKKESYEWSSCTLYTPEVQKNRSQLFKQKLRAIEKTDAFKVAAIHLDYDQRNIENGFVMNRHDYVKTISLTQIDTHQDFFNLKHINLIQDEEINQKIYILH
jgi:uncharacterized protein with NRDE domain